MRSTQLTNLGVSYTSIRNYEFRESVRNGRKVVETVGLPRDIELAGLRDKFKIKPWSSKNERERLNATVRAATASLKFIKTNV